MDRLNYTTLEKIGYEGYIKRNAPEKVLQFGEGNFLRAFADYFFDCSNEKAEWNGKVVVVQPLAEGMKRSINQQQGLYTLYLRGREHGKEVNQRRIISCINRCLNPYEDFDAVINAAISDDLELIVSNTTEAGIVYDENSAFDQWPPDSFPAKLTKLLYERFCAGKKGVVILSCELIDDNGKELKKCVKRHSKDWKLGREFESWIEQENLFCSTLVDRIVPGKIKDPSEAARLESENGYQDVLIDVGEVFGVWIIEGPKELEDRLPFKKAGLPVHVVPDVAPYKKRKVRILNGTHTGFALGAYLAGEDIVRDSMENEIIRRFMDRMLREEVIPTLPLDREDLLEFAEAVKERFANPFIDHQLLSISLNSTAKWRARNMPSLITYIQMEGRLPQCLTMSLALYIAFYSNKIQSKEKGALLCLRSDGSVYRVQDDPWVLDFYYDHRNDSAEELAEAVLKNRQMWGRDLRQIADLLEAVAGNLQLIRGEGPLAAFASCLQ